MLNVPNPGGGKAATDASISYSLPHLRRLREAATQKTKLEHIESDETLEEV